MSLTRLAARPNIPVEWRGASVKSYVGEYPTRLCVPYTRLFAWLSQQFGPDRRFKSARQLSLAAGFSQNVTGATIERGSAKPETLVQIVRALEVSPVSLFVIAGWLTEEDVTPGASEAEAKALSLARRLPRGFFEEWLESGERLLRLLQRSIAPSRVAEEGNDYRTGPGPPQVQR